MRKFAMLGISVALCGCGFVHDQVLVERYHLVAVDDREDMMLCWHFDNGDCEALGEGTLFAVGYNEKYVTEAIHPHQSDGPADRKRTVYYYVIRDPKTELKESGVPYGGVKGPFTPEQYLGEKARLGLPQFTIVFNDLK